MTSLSGLLSRLAGAAQGKREPAQDSSNEALLGAVTDSMSEGVIAVDAAGCFLLFNAAARDVFQAGTAGGALSEWRQTHMLYELDGKTRWKAGDSPLSRALRGETADNM